MNARLASRWIVFGAVVASLLLFVTVRSGVAVDGNSNGISDIWALLYPGASNPTADTDGDGVSNLDESIWGSNPFQIDSQYPGLTTLTLNGLTGNIDISWRNVPGKRYQLQSSTNLTLGGWTNDGAFVDGLLNVVALTNSRPFTPQLKFYRVHVSDKDTDGDGVNDWEELLIGLNPNATNSNVDGIHDGAYVTNQLALPNTVTIQATQPFASKDGPQAGTLTITRAQKLFPITINLARSGTAIPGIDFVNLPTSVTLGPGVTTTNIDVSPVPNLSVTGNRSVSIALTPGGPGSGFALDSFTNATVIINESTAPTGTGLLARYYDTASSTYADAANFGQAGTYAYTRTVAGPPASGTIVVPYTNTPALAVGNVVKLTFTSGNLNNALYNHMNYTVTAVTNGVSFAVGISSAGTLPASGTGNCSFSIQSFAHPAVIERVDPTVDFTWLYGTPNGVVISPNNSPDNYSATWDAYLQPTTAGNYVFQLDADDKARVLLDTGSGLVQILEHGWDGPATNGIFKQSTPVTFAVPATPAQRYHIRVEHVETTGDARCRLQWSVNGGAFANIPQANQFTHTSAMSANYNYTRTNATPGAMSGNIVVTLNGHTFATNDSVQLFFSSGNLFTPTNGNFHGAYTVTAVTATTFTVEIAAASLPASGTGAGFVANQPNSTTTGLFNLCYANTAFSGAPGRVGVDAAVTTGNNGIWGAGTPDANLIQPDTFSIRWTGQVQPQFSEEYTFLVNCDDGCTLWINGQPQVLRTVVSANTAGSTNTYDAVTGNTVINYSGLIVSSNSFVVGETVRLDPTSGILTNATGSTYSYDGGTGLAVIDYSNLTNVTPGGFITGETVDLDPTSGTLSSLGTLPYVITNVTANTFTVDFGTGTFATGSGSINIADTRNAVITAATATNFTVNLGPGKYVVSSTNNTISVDIINKPLKDWSSTANERYVRIPMIGGVRYDIQLDYYENTSSAKCQLSWYSPSQPKQIIPRERLYPGNGALAPASFTGETDATALVGGLFSYTVTGNNGASVSVSGLRGIL